MKCLCFCLILTFSTWSSRTGAKADLAEPELDPNVSLDEDAFLAKFNEVVNDPVEKEKRSKALKKNENNIRRVNRDFINGKSGFYEKINSFSDLPEDEFRKERTGLLEKPKYGRGLLISNTTKSDPESERYFDQFRYSRKRVPSTYSSLDKGYVTEVKSQELCGSCTAFASVAAMETVFAKLTGVLTDYSEQELVECGYDGRTAKGCKGAFIDSYFRYMINNNRLLMKESFFPYMAKKCEMRNNCPAETPHNIGARAKQVLYTPYGNEELLKQLVALHGAVVVATTTDMNWENYWGGVLDRCTSDDLMKPDNGQHATVVVGYGKEIVQGRWTDYWLIKNSWSTQWGEGGFIKLKRGVGLCGIGKELAVLIAEANNGKTDDVDAVAPCMDTYCNCAQLTFLCNRITLFQEQCMKTCGVC